MVAHSSSLYFFFSNNKAGVVFGLERLLKGLMFQDTTTSTTTTRPVFQRGGGRGRGHRFKVLNQLVVNRMREQGVCSKVVLCCHAALALIRPHLHDSVKESDAMCDVRTVYIPHVFHLRE
jgi:hypothetical protein